MQKYDKIGVPGLSVATPWVASHGPFIVFTVPEVRQLWMDAQEAFANDVVGMKDQHTIQSYMLSKGINIEG